LYVLTLGARRPGDGGVFTLACSAVLAALAGCDGGGRPAQRPVQQPPVNVQPIQPVHVQPGRIVGLATTPTGKHELTGLLTVDGTLRMSVYGSAAMSFDLDGSVQFVGNVQLGAPDASGSGVVIGQACSAAAANRFCNAATPSAIRLTALDGIDNAVAGELRIAVAAGDEVWPLEIGYWGGRPHLDPASSLQTLQGTYEELVAEFADGGGVLITVDSVGRLFFQSPITGCIGNGTLSVDGDAAANLYDVALTIAGCAAPYVALNNEFTGLSTFEPTAPWDYGLNVHKMWLSTSATAASPAALMLWAGPTY
jgi:hypothetical protein